MSLTLINKSLPRRAVPRSLQFAMTRGKSLAIRLAGGASLATLIAVGHAFAQATSPTGGLGAQLNSMSSEAINSGGEFGGMTMYAAALACFVGGVWAVALH